VIENIAKIDSLVFDKTGTITSVKEQQINYEGTPLTIFEKEQLKTILRNSNHPLSRTLYDFFKNVKIHSLNKFEEIIGQGIQGEVEGQLIKVGTFSYIGTNLKPNKVETAVYISINNEFKGKFTFKNSYRKGMFSMFQQLASKYHLALLSGDNEGEKEYLKTTMPNETSLTFNQKPENKLKHIKQKQDNGNHVLMFGDGLNDAGALAQSNVGIAVSENVNVFSPACDAIIDAQTLNKIPVFLKIAKQSITIIKASFVLSFLYNFVGLYFAISGQLSPVIAAILMPLSSISVVIFVTILTNYISKPLEAP